MCIPGINGRGKFTRRSNNMKLFSKSKKTDKPTSTSPTLAGLYPRGKLQAWKLTSPAAPDKVYIFFGKDVAAKKEANKLFTDNGMRPRIRLLNSI